MLWRMTDEQQLIFDWIDGLPVIVPNWGIKLPKMYRELNAKFFGNRARPLSANFVTCRVRAQGSSSTRRRRWPNQPLRSKSGQVYGSTRISNV